MPIWCQYVVVSNLQRVLLHWNMWTLAQCASSLGLYRILGRKIGVTPSRRLYTLLTQSLIDLPYIAMWCQYVVVSNLQRVLLHWNMWTLAQCASCLGIYHIKGRKIGVTPSRRLYALLKQSLIHLPNVYTVLRLFEVCTTHFVSPEIRVCWHSVLHNALHSLSLKHVKDMQKIGVASESQVTEILYD